MVRGKFLELREEVAAGRVVISRKRSGAEGKPIGIGRGLRTKINANIGTSRDRCDIGFELEKLETAVRFGADTVMDLSTGRLIDETRSAILAASNVPIGTVPIYQAVTQVKRVEDLTPDDFVEMIELILGPSSNVCRRMLPGLTAGLVQMREIIPSDGAFTCSLTAPKVSLTSPMI